eukprot:CCRYP_010778-RA/>CCRYP_010778-RA protein AED:0.27 eAED:0.27 QI:0/0/0/1/0/0/3/0/269
MQGYFQGKLIPGLWSHKQRPIQFSLVVDNFGIKYTGQANEHHLLTVLEEHYNVTANWTGTPIHAWLCGQSPKQFHHPKPTSPQDAPFPSIPINYGAKKQYATPKTTSPPLDKADKHFIQQVCGKFLFLGRAVDPTLICPISAIASQSAHPTEDTMKQTRQLLDYLASHDDAVPSNNGAILNIAHIIKHVMASATEAELGALYITDHEVVYLRIILDELGLKQPATPIQTDNSMAEGIINGKVQPKHRKAMDMRFCWLHDRECQEQFRNY